MVTTRRFVVFGRFKKSSPLCWLESLPETGPLAVPGPLLTGYWKATGRILGKFLWKIRYKHREIIGGVYDLQDLGDHTPPL